MATNQEALDAYKKGGLADFSKTLVDVGKPAPYLTPEQQANQTAGRGIFDNGKTVITPASLTPAQPVNFTPVITPAPPVTPPAIVPPVETPLTPEQNKAQGVISDIQNLQNKYLGKSAYTQTQETAQGINDKTKTVTDLTNKFNQIKAEADAIPLQTQNDIKGQMVTSNGVSTINADKLRTNAIQALSTSALLSAAQNNLATAQSFVDRAVAAQFDPIDAQIKNAKENLDLIIKSPKYTQEEKAQAQAQLDIQNKKQADIDKDKLDKTTIYNTGVEAAKLGADALTLSKINAAKTPEEAIQIATAAGVYKIADNQKMILAGYTKLNPSQLKGLTEADIIRMPDGTIYKKPNTDLATINSLQAKYPDAGILSTDNIATATEKLKKSAIYQKDVNTGKTTFTQIGTDSLGRPIMGFVNTENQTVTPTTQTTPNQSFSEWEKTIGTVTQDFNTPTNYIAGRTTHGGYDIAGSENKPITSPVSGKVVEITSDNGKGTGWGNSVVIQDASGNQWRLAHFNAINVKNGDTVTNGQQLGLLGNTGKVMGEGGGYHVHIEAKDASGKLIDIGKMPEKTPLFKDGKPVTVRLNKIDYQVNSDGTYSNPQVPEETKQASELKTQASTSAQELLDKINKGEGTSAVGKSRIFGLQKVPGTAAANFEIQFNNLKSLLSLDNVKLLKGQGQVSDAERRLLSEASAKLDLAQSEPEFKKALEDIVKTLKNVSENTTTGEKYIIGTTYEDSGKTYVITNENGDIKEVK